MFQRHTQINVGYVENWAAKNLKEWDVNIERRAGGLTSGTPTCPKLTLTNQSSLFALIAQFVWFHKNQQDVPEVLLSEFCSIRVLLYLGATPEEIVSLNDAENIDQHERKRYTELDSVDTVALWMRSVKKYEMSESNSLDVVKYGLALGDPRKPGQFPQWMLKGIAGRPNNIESRLLFLKTTQVTKRFLTDQKMVVPHPVLSTYAGVQSRHRFLKGFFAVQELHDLADYIGKKGMASRGFPLSRSVLLDNAILLAEAFTAKSEREAVPLWRDGETGKILQKTMVECLRRRFEESTMSQTSSKSEFGTLFATGQNWASFARLAKFIDMALEQQLGAKGTWPVSAIAMHRDFWRGDHDVLMSELASTLPGHLDTTPHLIIPRLKECFKPLSRVFRDIEIQKSQLFFEKLGVPLRSFQVSVRWCFFLIAFEL